MGCIPSAYVCPRLRHWSREMSPSSLKTKDTTACQTQFETTFLKKNPTSSTPFLLFWQTTSSQHIRPLGSGSRSQNRIPDRKRFKPGGPCILKRGRWTRSLAFLRTQKRKYSLGTRSNASWRGAKTPGLRQAQAINQMRPQGLPLVRCKSPIRGSAHILVKYLWAGA